MASEIGVYSPVLFGFEGAWAMAGSDSALPNACSWEWYEWGSGSPCVGAGPGPLGGGGGAALTLHVCSVGMMRVGRSVL